MCLRQTAGFQIVMYKSKKLLLYYDVNILDKCLYRDILWIVKSESMTSISHDKYLNVSVRMLFRECSCKNAGVAGYAEAFTTVLSGKQTSET